MIKNQEVNLYDLLRTKNVSDLPRVNKCTVKFTMNLRINNVFNLVRAEKDFVLTLTCCNI